MIVTVCSLTCPSCAILGIMMIVTVCSLTCPSCAVLGIMMIVTVCSQTCPSCADSRYNDDLYCSFSDLSFT